MHIILLSFIALSQMNMKEKDAMKRVVCFALALLLLGPCRAWADMAERVPAVAAARTVTAEGALTLSAPSAVLMEKETGAVLYEKNAREPGFPASITKIMTMLLIIEAMESGAIGPDDVVTASARAASFGGSCVYLEAGEQMSVREMLKCIAVVSANDCAVAMAEQLCGTEEVFVRKMNERARELGMQNTHFSNCTGLFDDGEHFTTAYDVALMSRELIKHDAIKEYTTIWMDSIRGGSFELSNTNKLVYWYPGCAGLKTGYTSTARFCLSATAERDGAEYIAVVMHADSSDARNQDAETLLNYAFANYRLLPLAEARLPESLPVELGARGTVPLYLEGPGTLVAPRGGEPEYSLRLPSQVSAPVQEGARLGLLTVRLGGKTLAELPVCAGEAVGRLGYGGMLRRLAGSLVGL